MVTRKLLSDLRGQNEAARKNHTDQLNFKSLPSGSNWQQINSVLYTLVDSNGLPKPDANGKHADYDLIESRMAKTIGDIRQAAGDKVPSEHPGRMAETVNGIRQWLKMGGKNKQQLQTAQSGKVNDWRNQNTQMASQASVGALPFEQTEKGQEQTAAHKNAMELAGADKTEQERFISEKMKGGSSREDAERLWYQIERPSIRLQKQTFNSPSRGGSVQGSFDPSSGRYYDEQGVEVIDAQALPKTSSPGSQYMHALVKKNSGQQLTPEDNAALKSYPEYVKQTSVIPGVARASAYASMRPMTVINPENPQQTMVVTARQAERGGYATPQSIEYQLDAYGHKAMIPRNLGQNLAALNTAQDHLQMLTGMVSSLGNGNYQIFNAASQRWAEETGDPAPTNFDTLKTSLEGEMARAFTGVGATTQEIASIGAIIDRANSPQQLYGALQTAKATMDARSKNMWGQVNAATSAPLGGKVYQHNRELQQKGGSSKQQSGTFRR